MIANQSTSFPREYADITEGRLPLFSYAFSCIDKMKIYFTLWIRSLHENKIFFCSASKWTSFVLREDMNCYQNNGLHNTSVAVAARGNYKNNHCYILNLKTCKKNVRNLKLSSLMSLTVTKLVCFERLIRR